MIEDIGRVVKIAGDKAFVEVERSSACAQCGLQEVEELTAGGKPVFEAINMVNAKPGDKVKVQVQSVAYIKASFFIYGLPVLLMLIGAIFGIYLAGKLNKSPDTMSVLSGFAGLITGILTIYLFRKRGTRREYLPVIVEVLGEDGTS